MIKKKYLLQLNNKIRKNKTVKINKKVFSRKLSFFLMLNLFW